MLGMFFYRRLFICIIYYSIITNYQKLRIKVLNKDICIYLY